MPPSTTVRLTLRNPAFVTTNTTTKFTIPAVMSLDIYPHPDSAQKPKKFFVICHLLFQSLSLDV